MYCSIVILPSDMVTRADGNVDAVKLAMDIPLKQNCEQVRLAGDLGLTNIVLIPCSKIWTSGPPVYKEPLSNAFNYDRIGVSRLNMEFQLLPQLARSQSSIDKDKLQSAASVDEALEIARASL
ncbi:hypothetical protein Tco_1126033 [Tanacetum coccineum]